MDGSERMKHKAPDEMAKKAESKEAANEAVRESDMDLDMAMVFKLNSALSRSPDKVAPVFTNASALKKRRSSPLESKKYLPGGFV